jgi:hypothetical protein
MFNNKKLPAGTLLAAGLAAFAYYKYSKLSDEQKNNLVGDLKQKAQDLYDRYAPAELKDVLNKKGPSTASSTFGEGSDYSS